MTPPAPVSALPTCEPVSCTVGGIARRAARRQTAAMVRDRSMPYSADEAAAGDARAILAALSRWPDVIMIVMSERERRRIAAHLPEAKRGCVIWRVRSSAQERL